MKVLMLDSNTVVDLDFIEAVRRIDARMAAEVPVNFKDVLRSPESAMLDRAPETAVKPRPQPRPGPERSSENRSPEKKTRRKRS